MDNQEELYPQSRAEYIRLARESCTRNLGINNLGKNRNLYKEMYKEQRKALMASYSDANQDKFGDTTILSSVNMKFLLLRIICCCLLFLSVFIFDKFDITIKDFNVDTVKQYITSNEGVKEAQDFFISLYESVVKNEKK